MKKSFFIALLMITVLSCEKDEPTFNYPMEDLYGTWMVTHVKQSDGGMFDVTTYLGMQVFEPTYAEFKADGTYRGKGFFGNGRGTYTAIGNTITCMIDGVEFVRYDVLRFSGEECELSAMFAGSDEPVVMRCRKQ